MKFLRSLALLLIALAAVIALTGILIQFDVFKPPFPTPTLAAAVGTPAVTSSPAGVESIQPLPTGQPAQPTPELRLAETSTPVPTEPASVPDEPPPPTIPANASEAFEQGIIHRRNGDYARAATAFRSVAQDDSDPDLARLAQFRLGEALYLAADFTNALPALGAVIEERDDDDLAARAHYFLGDIYTQQQQYENALSHLRAYRKTTRALAGVIDAEIASVMLAAGDSAAALEQYEVALEDPLLSSAERVAYLKKMAEIHLAREEPERAVARLADALELAPNDRARADVVYNQGLAYFAAGDKTAAFERWRHALVTYTREPGGYLSVVKLVEHGAPNINELQRGIADYYARQYDLAIEAFRRYIAANDVPGAEVLYFAGLAYQGKGDQAGALRNFEVLLQSYPKDPRVPDALYGKAVSLARQGNYDASLDVYRQLIKQHPAYERADDGLWSLANAYESAGQYEKASAVFREVARTFPASTYAPTALLAAGVSDHIEQNEQQAQSAWNSAIQNYPESPWADGAAYWLGKVARAHGSGERAEELFRQASQPPRSYYSWRALDALGEELPAPSYNVEDYALRDTPPMRAQLEEWIAGWSGASVSADLPTAVLADASFKRASEFAALDRPLDARPLFATVNERFADNAHALYALALYLKDINYFSSSIDAAARLAKLSGQSDTQLPLLLRQLIYPTYYADLVVAYAKRHGFDPALFFALIRQESTFNPQSLSSASARGLTQVVPGTGAEIARSLGVSNFEQNDLFKPYISVRFGTYYLAVVLDMFDGNVHYALLGYNGGPGNARKWMNSDVDLAVELVPYPESQLYVRTVYDQFRHYVDIYRGGG